MTRIADLSDAPIYTTRAGQQVTAVRIDAVMHRDEGLFIALGGSDLYPVPPSVATRVDVGDYLVDAGDEEGQLVYEGHYFEQHCTEGEEPGEVITLIEVGDLNDRVTLSDIEGAIASARYHRLDGTLTVCVLTLDNGFSVTGESACVDPDNFDESVGRKIAYDNAVEKCWPLFGFVLAEMRYLKRLAEGAEGVAA